MAIPDLTSPTKVEAKNNKAAVTTTASGIVSNGVASGTTVRVVSLYISNVDGTTAADVTVDVFDGATATRLCNTVSVPADSTLSVVTREDVVYLMEGDSLRITASANNMLEAVVSFEEIA